MKQSPLSPNDEAQIYSDQTWSVGAQVSLSVDKAILGGKFMGSAPDGRVVWLKSATPLALGDLVRGQITKEAKRSFEISVQTIHTPSQHRQDTFCPHVERCGGCPWQALSTSDQLSTLTRDIGRMISRSINQKLVWDQSFFDSKQSWRNTARIHSNGQGQLGFYGPQGIFDLDHCPVFSDTLNQQLQALRHEVSPLLKRGRAELRLSAAENTTSGTVAFQLRGPWSLDLIDDLSRRLDQLIDRYDSIHGITLEAHTPELLSVDRPDGHTPSKRRKHNRHLKEKRGKTKRPHHRSTKSRQTRQHTATRTEFIPISQSWGYTHNDLNGVAHPAQAFMQAHQRGNQTLIETVVRGAEGSAHILELYAGSGNFTIALAQAQQDRQILALEYDARAVEALNHLAQQNGLQIQAEAQSINSLPPGDFDHIVLDPPRAGAAPIVEALAKSSATYITYISCHPAALARDLSSLSKNGWIVDRAQLFHLFPHSGHAEVYCRLKNIK